MEPEAQVALAYRAVLRRPVDPDGLATYAKALREGRDLAWLVGVLADSNEFRSLEAREQAPPGFPLDSAAPMQVATACSPAELQALWDRVTQVWAQWGETDPYWSVLTEDRFRGAARLEGADLAAFHESGAEEVRRLNAWLCRAGLVPGQDATCVEYGCGVGRVTRSLARQFGQVVGFDVSEPHLKVARRQLAADGIGNARLVRVRGPAELEQLAGADLFYSVISLQHSPPPIILDVLEHAFAGLRPGGCAFFQVPTYARGYAYQVGTPAGSPEMEMHFVPQRAVLALAQRTGLTVAEVQPDWCAGRPGEWISSTFLLVKESGRA